MQSLKQEEYHWRKYITDKAVKHNTLKEMAKIKVKQIKSKINSTLRQKRTLEALGIKKMHQVVEHEGTPQILGMVNKVKHLVTVEGA